MKKLLVVLVLSTVAALPLAAAAQAPAPPRPLPVWRELGLNEVRRPLIAHATSKRPAAPMPPPMHMVQTT